MVIEKPGRPPVVRGRPWHQFPSTSIFPLIDLRFRSRANGTQIKKRKRGTALNTEDLWRLERGAIEQEVAQDLSNPEYIFYTRLLETLFRERT